MGSHSWPSFLFFFPHWLIQLSRITALNQIRSFRERSQCRVIFAYLCIIYLLSLVGCTVVVSHLLAPSPSAFALRASIYFICPKINLSTSSCLHVFTCEGSKCMALILLTAAALIPAELHNSVPLSPCISVLAAAFCGSHSFAA